jgi:hypothetical protein
MRVTRYTICQGIGTSTAASLDASGILAGRPTDAVTTFRA